MDLIFNVIKDLFKLIPNLFKNRRYKKERQQVVAYLKNLKNGGFYTKQIHEAMFADKSEEYVLNLLNRISKEDFPIIKRSQLTNNGILWLNFINKY